MSTEEDNPANGQPSESTALRLVNWLTERAIDGVPPLHSAECLAGEYLNDGSYPDDGARIDSLINWETTKNFTSGFVTGLGGLLVLPIAIPGAFAASWIIQARMAGAIAKIGGHDIREDRIKTFIVACLVGDALKDMAKAAGIQVGTKLAKTVINQVPGRLLIAINKQVGQRLLTKAGQTGAVNLIKLVPFVGGFVGGAFDAYACRVVGMVAKDLFHDPRC